MKNICEGNNIIFPYIYISIQIKREKTKKRKEKEVQLISLIGEIANYSAG